MLSRMWRLAPLGHLQGLLEGLRFQITVWASWHRECGYLSAAALDALPYITLLLLDAQVTGLAPFRALVDGPLGLLTVALIVCRNASCLRTLLLAAGVQHANRWRGGSGWLWVFWTSFPSLAQQWIHERHFWGGNGSLSTADLEQAVRALQPLVVAKREDGKFPELHRCNTCGEWRSEGNEWDHFWYCTQCSDAWFASRHEASYGTSSADLDDPTSAPELAKVSAESPEPIAATSLPVLGVLHAASDADSSSAWSPGKRWTQAKWTPGVDQIDFSEAEVMQAKALMPAATAPLTETSTTPIGRLAERCTGIGASELYLSLSGLDSLKIISLVSTLRRELDVNVAARDVARCASLQELEELCASEAETHEDFAAVKENGHSAKENGYGAKQNGHSEWKIFAIPTFWRAPVGWLLRLDAVPDQDAMCAACYALVRRHPGLHATPPDEGVAQLCNQGTPQVLALGELFNGTFGAHFTKKAGQCFLEAWPKVSAVVPAETPQAESEAAHFKWLRFEDESDLRHAAWLRSRGRGFHPPVSIAVLLLAGAGEVKDQAYLHVAVNHAVCDASCIVPLVADLLALHRAALECFQTSPNLGKLATAALDVAALPPAPNGLAVQQSRLRAAFEGSPADAMNLCEGLIQTRRRGYDHYVRLLPTSVAVLEAGAASLGIPSDHLLVTVIASAFASVSGWPLVKLSLIVPMRDGHGEGQAVANLASTRHLNIWFHGRSMFAVAIELSGRLRRREWDLVQPLEDDGDRVFINVRGLPRLDAVTWEVEKVDTRKATTRFVKNILEMFVDQETLQSWTLYIGMRDDVVGTRFAEALRAALWAAATEPLGPSSCPTSTPLTLELPEQVTRSPQNGAAPEQAFSSLQRTEKLT